MKTFITFILFLASLAVNAQIIRVYPSLDSTFSNIQAGLDAAQPGDTVLVADGIYYEQIDFMGKKPLLVTSNYIFDGDSSHIYNTIIDGSHLMEGNASVVKFTESTDTTSIIAGFTIRKGKGTTYNSAKIGGGIYLFNSGGKIIHNRIIQNSLSVQYVSSGGGIACIQDTGNNNVIIRDNFVDNNTCYREGGGIYSNMKTICEKNTISNNKSFSGSNSFGGGIDCNDADIIFRYNKVQYNNIKGGPYWPDDCAKGGGFHSSGAKLIFTNNEFIGNNTSNTSTEEWGGGAYIEDSKPGTIIKDNYFEGNSSYIGGGLYAAGELELIIEKNTFIENHADRDGGGAFMSSHSTWTVKKHYYIENNYFERNTAGWGGAMVLNGSTFINRNTFIENEALVSGGAFSGVRPSIVSNNIFYKNKSQQRGGAFEANAPQSWDPKISIINNTFSENNALTAGGAIRFGGCYAYLLNNIFWNNTAPSGAEIYEYCEDDFCGSFFAYNNIDTTKIYGDFEILEGNINESMFFNENPYLMPVTSNPCINAGIGQYIFPFPDTLYAPPIDILGQPRPMSGGYDMGAYEVFIEGIPEEELKLEFSTYPNPFSEQLFCHYRLEKASNVIISLYDILGKLQFTRQETLDAGEHSTHLNTGIKQNGVYLIKVQVDDLNVVRKIIRHK